MPKNRYNISLDMELVEKVKQIPLHNYPKEEFSFRIEEALRLFIEKYQDGPSVAESVTEAPAPGSDADLQLHPEKKAIDNSFRSIKSIMNELWAEQNNRESR